MIAAYNLGLVISMVPPITRYARRKEKKPLFLRVHADNQIRAAFNH